MRRVAGHLPNPVCGLDARSRAGTDAHPSGAPVSAGGFTLLEVLLAMVILVAAAAIILARVQLMMAYNDRITRHQQEARAVLNHFIHFTATDPALLNPALEGERLIVRSLNEIKPVAEVKNYTFNEQFLVPVDQAYTPFQLYSLVATPGERYTLSVLLDGLKSR